MYLTANVERMSGSEQLLLMKPFFLMCQVREAWGERWCWEGDVQQCISVTALKKKTSLAYALGKFLFIMPFFVQVDSLKEKKKND